MKGKNKKLNNKISLLGKKGLKILPLTSNLKPQAVLTQMGSSLLETSLALGLSLLMMAFGWEFGAAFIHQFRKFDHRIEIQQQDRIGLDMLLAELQSAGTGIHPSQPVFLSGTSNAIRFKTNLKQVQTITYYINKNKQLLRKVDKGGPNEVANHIEKLKFQYFDRGGRVTENLNAIYRVKVTLTTKDKNGTQRTLSSAVWVRNQ